MIGFKLYSILVLVVVVGLASDAQAAEEPLTEFDDEILITPDLKDKPEQVYEHLKKYLSQNSNQQQAEAEVRVDGLGKLTIQQLVGACGSIEGNCDITNLGQLDDELFEFDGESDWKHYALYCRSQWVKNCKATETMLRKVQEFSDDEWANTYGLVNSILVQPIEPRNHAKPNEIYSRYPQGVVEFMRSKDASLDDILKLKKDKREQFKRRFVEIVRPVCQRVVSGLKDAVLAMKWAHEANSSGANTAEESNPLIESGLKMFRVCLKISVNEDELLRLSYNFFAGKKESLKSKLRGVTLSLLGATD